MSDQLRKRDWMVRPVPMRDARHLVQTLHYSKDYAGSAAYIHGLLRRDGTWIGHVYGVAVWNGLLPLMRRFGVLPLALSRLAIEPDVPTNAATFLLSHSVRQIDRKRWPVLVTYADTAQGHTGAIYKGANWTYDGLGGDDMFYNPETGQLISTMPGGHRIPRPEGWERRRTKKHRFLNIAPDFDAAAASSDAVGIQPDEGGSQPTPPLQLWDPAA